MTERLVLNYGDVTRAAEAVAERWSSTGLSGVYGVPRGGCVPAAMVASCLGLPLVDAPSDGVLVIDDLVDSGRTAVRYADRPFDALYRKQWSPEDQARHAVPVGDRWVVFPWETGEELGPIDAVVRLLEHIGEDPARSGLADTPGRVVRSLAEMTAGYAVDPAELLGRTFDEEAYDEMVVVRSIDFTSMCEHHLLTFTGSATVAYIPDGQRVVGLSKLARLVDCFAMRLQLQERLTIQIADAIETHLHPRGVGVLLRAHHSCMGCRGVRKPRAEMVTSRLTGLFKDDPKARAEFLSLAE